MHNVSRIPPYTLGLFLVAAAGAGLLGVVLRVVWLRSRAHRCIRALMYGFVFRRVIMYGFYLRMHGHPYVPKRGWLECVPAGPSFMLFICSCIATLLLFSPCVP